MPLELDLYKVGSGNTELALSYMDLALWRQTETAPGSPSNQATAFVFGLTTPQTVVAGLTGSAHYAGVAYGSAVDAEQQAAYTVSGSSTFDVSFSAQTMSGSMNLTGARIGGGAGQNFGTFSFSGAMPANGPLPPGNVGLAATAIPISYNGVVQGPSQIQAQFLSLIHI